MSRSQGSAKDDDESLAKYVGNKKIKEKVRLSLLSVIPDDMRRVTTWVLITSKQASCSESPLT